MGQTGEGMNKTKCKCGQEISFIKSAKSGKWMPVNAEIISVHKDGNMWELNTGKFLGEKEGAALVLEDGTVVRVISNGMTGYMPHWSVCPHANDFRKEKK